MSIDQSVLDKFEAVVESQRKRIMDMKAQDDFIDYSKLDKLIIGVCGGDGIGPMITGMAQHALEVLLADKVKAGKVEFRVIDGLTIERRAELGCAIPPAVMEELKKFDLNDVVVDVEDKGALDFVIRSRLQCAICRGAEISYNWAEEDGHGKQ